MRATITIIPVPLVFMSLLGCAESADSFQITEFRCDDHDGNCTVSPTDICSEGLEPLTDNDPIRTDCFGHCCIPAPETVCTISANINCVPDACEGKWRPVSGDPPCEDGRVCCFWNE